MLLMKIFGKSCALTGIALCALPLPLIVFLYLGAIGEPGVTLGSELTQWAVLPYVLWGFALYLVGVSLLYASDIPTYSYFFLGLIICYSPMLSPNMYPFLLFTALLLSAWSIVAGARIVRATEA